MAGVYRFYRYEHKKQYNEVYPTLFVSIAGLKMTLNQFTSLFRFYTFSIEPQLFIK